MTSTVYLQITHCSNLYSTENTLDTGSIGHMPAAELQYAFTPSYRGRFIRWRPKAMIPEYSGVAQPLKAMIPEHRGVA